jgi:hypothetical protein
MTVSGCHLRWLATLALALIMFGAVTSRVDASPLRQLAGSTTSFATDGVRYAAWQVDPAAPIVVLDALNGSRREFKMPGCALDSGEGGYATAAAGRFLLNCPDEASVQALLDVRTGKTVLLPNDGESSGWYRVGTRYVMGVNKIYDIATGATASLKRPADLDAPGASLNAFCPAIRRLVLHNPWQGFGERYAAEGDLFVQVSAEHGNVQIDRCHGRPTILTGHGGTTFGLGEPEDFNIRGGLLSWDTGSTVADYMPPKGPFRGSLYAYQLGSHRRHMWLLPRLNSEAGGPKGTFGYSTHTANMVFWIATRTLADGEVLSVETSSVYAASLK